MEADKLMTSQEIREPSLLSHKQKGRHTTPLFALADEMILEW